MSGGGETKLISWIKLIWNQFGISFRLVTIPKLKKILPQNFTIAGGWVIDLLNSKGHWREEKHKVSSRIRTPVMAAFSYRAPLAGAVEYTDSISAEKEDSPTLKRVQDMTLNYMMLRFQ